MDLPPVDIKRLGMTQPPIHASFAIRSITTHLLNNHSMLSKLDQPCLAPSGHLQAAQLCVFGERG
jgi:hypothetical protein